MAQEEKFKEAKRLHETANADQKYGLESLFPELKESESEDERMMRIIEDAICTNEAQQLVKTKYGLELTDLADWIEKMGELQKSINKSESKFKVCNNSVTDKHIKIMAKITKKVDNLGDHEFWFDNESWVRINENEEYYEYQSDPNDGETYFEGCLEFDDDKTTLEGYDGCYKLPEEVILACKELGLKIDEYIEM